ncbi:hypothetical protein C1H46_041552 [Malus baccata]|uniref:Uncharacterized protein n=1 Tax=Malus baccata TaxID=106549 RepID=A0A540KFK2_MALBA|nr:hypothetical protein C1H46_041552 [Malus baccata]
MSQLITRRRSVINVPLAFSAPITSTVSAPLIREPTPLTEASPRASQVPASSTSSVSVQPLNARRPYRCRCDPEPFDHTSSTSTIEGGGLQPEIYCWQENSGVKDTSPPFWFDALSFWVKAQRQERSKFLELDMFKNVYARLGDETTKQFHRTAVLQEVASQLPLETPIEDIIIPEDVGKAQVHETGGLIFQIDHRTGHCPGGGSGNHKR